VLFGTAVIAPKPDAEGVSILRFIGDAAGGILVVLVVPVVAILAVGAPVALAVRLVLSALGLL
jgi:hypothetical protein